MKQMLIQLRADRRMTQAQLAKRAGVSGMVVYKMEHSKPVARESAAKVFAVLGVRADEVEGVDMAHLRCSRGHWLDTASTVYRLREHSGAEKTLTRRTNA